MPETAFKGSALAKARSDVAVAHRRRDAEAIEKARQRLAEEKLASYFTKVLASTPPLTDDQRYGLMNRLGELLGGAR